MTGNSQPQPDWHHRARTLTWDGRPLIDGTRVDADPTMDIVSPVGGQRLYSAVLSTPDIVDRAVLSARSAFETGRWSDMSPRARGLILLRLADLIAREHEDLALRDTLEMGKPIGASLSEVGGFAPALCRHYAEAADKIYGEVAGSDSGSLGFTLREPRGVVAAIAPWNYPLANAVIKAIPALAAGNCVILKPSEMSPATALRLGELALEAGVPPGVFNIVPGDGSITGMRLVSHPDVDMVTFTGSTAAGRTIMSAASRHRIRPVMLECGGKSPQIIFADAPPTDLIAPAILGAVLTNQGQLCVARSRILVHRSRHDELVSALEREVAGYTVGDPLDPATGFGPLAGLKQFERVSAYIAGAIESGARMIAGGKTERHCGVAPTIFADVTEDMAVVREEIFGPVVTVQTFEDTDEAITLANATSYGLAATAWTAHYPTMQAVFRKLKTGHVTINATADAYEGPGLALSGEPRGDSGFGCETGLDSLRGYTALKGVVLAGGAT